VLLFALLACQESRVPADADHFTVTVTATSDTCHPDASEGYEETFEYAVFFADAQRAEVYVGEELFAVGTIAGCTLSYQTVVFGEETEADGNVKWQLFGEAQFDTVPGADACVDGEDDWLGEEVFEIVSSVDETLEPGCQYVTETRGKAVAAPAE
jgi:hypothetical protein